MISSLVIGRDAELARLESGLRLVSCAVILGLPGVGKSAMARRFAAQWPRKVWVQHAQEGASLDGLVDDLRRQLGDGAARPLSTEDERFSELAERLDDGGQLWLIEDADRVAGIERLLASLSARLGRGRVVVTARRRIFAVERGPERVEIVLDGLDQAAAFRLWQHLDELYGTAAGFAAAWQTWAGNPFQLRQAHAGVVDVEDPAAAAIATLPPAPRQLALALALAAEPLPREALALPESSSALQQLLARLIIEPAGAGRFTVHDLLRGALLRSAPAEALGAAHAHLADALLAAPMDEVVRVRERTRHLLGAGAHAAARALVLASAQQLIRAGAAAELLRLLERVAAPRSAAAIGERQVGEGVSAPAAGDPEIQLARARTLVRMLELHRAYDQIIALGAERKSASIEARVSLAHVAMLTGRLEQAASVCGSLLLARELSPTTRMRLVTTYVITRTAMGQGDSVRAEVGRHAEREAPPLLRAYLLFTCAFSLWLEERDPEAEEVMRTAWALCKDVLSFRARVLAPLFFASVLARTGNRAESARIVAEVESDVASFDDLLVLVSQRMIRVTLLECDGAFDEALRLAGEVEATYQQAGMVLASLWARLSRGRLLLLTGRIRAGRACLDELARTADELGARAIVSLARRAVEVEPLAAMASAAAPAPDQPRRARALVMAAVAAAAAGQREVARGYAVALEATRSASALDALTSALLTLVHAELTASASLYDQALAAAASAGADPELFPALAARLPRLSARAPIAAPSPDLSSAPILIDTVHHEVRSRELVIALARRPSVRRLLYTLAADPGRTHDKEALTRGIWNTSYHPTRHDGALWVNVKRLRELLHGTGLRVDSSDEGYRLRVDDGRVLRTS